MNISIVLATYKRSEILRRTLESFALMETDNLLWNLWIVDNACDPDTEFVVRSYINKLPINYIIESNPGKNKALNRALMEVNGNLIVFTDDDIIARQDWLIQLKKGAERWPECNIFGGKILAEWPGKIPFWGENHHLNQSIFGLHYPFDKEQSYTNSSYLPYGPNMMVRRDIFMNGYRFSEEIGPTNSTIYRMGSETEFIRRLVSEGNIAIYLPLAVVKHQIRTQQLLTTSLNRRNFRIGYSNVSPEDKIDNKMLGCSRYLWKQLLLTQIDRLKSYIFNDKFLFFENNCIYWRIRGKIFAQRFYNGASDSSFLQKFLRVD